MAASSSITNSVTNPATALHHYRGLNLCSSLTEDELRVNRCVERGLSDADIAAELFPSENA